MLRGLFQGVCGLPKLIDGCPVLRPERPVMTPESTPHGVRVSANLLGHLCRGFRTFAVVSEVLPGGQIGGDAGPVNL